jgi:hypothetical protein
VEPIADALLSAVRNLDLSGFQALWNTLESRFFTHLPAASFGPTIRMMESSLLRAFLVKACKVGKKDKLFEFFEVYSERLTRPGSDWEAWFALPYIREPRVHPKFEAYFSKKWSVVCVFYSCSLAANIDLLWPVYQVWHARHFA